MPPRLSVNGKRIGRPPNVDVKPTDVQICCVKCGGTSGQVVMSDYRIKMGRTAIGTEITVGLSVPKIHCVTCGVSYFDEDYVESRRADILQRLSGKN